MISRERVGGVLLGLGLVAAFLAVQPHFHRQAGTTATAAEAEHLKANPAHTPYREEYRFEWEGSPLLRDTAERQLVGRPDGSYTGRQVEAGRVGWASWSSLTLAAGAALLWAGWRLRRPRDRFDAKPSSP